jgi:hypothetical protein
MGRSKGDGGGILQAAFRRVGNEGRKQSLGTARGKELMKYAADTEVSAAKSQAEIKETLQRYGATKYAYYEDEDKAGIRCEINRRQIQFIVPLPDRLADEYVYRNHSSGKKIVRDIGEQHKM